MLFIIHSISHTSHNVNKFVYFPCCLIYALKNRCRFGNLWVISHFQQNCVPLTIQWRRQFVTIVKNNDEIMFFGEKKIWRQFLINEHVPIKWAVLTVQCLCSMFNVHIPNAYIWLRWLEIRLTQMILPTNLFSTNEPNYITLKWTKKRIENYAFFCDKAHFFMAKLIFVHFIVDWRQNGDRTIAKPLSTCQ